MSSAAHRHLQSEIAGKPDGIDHVGHAPGGIARDQTPGHLMPYVAPTSARADAAKADLQLAQQQFDRIKVLAGQQVVSQADLDKATVISAWCPRFRLSIAVGECRSMLAKGRKTINIYQWHAAASDWALEESLASPTRHLEKVKELAREYTGEALLALAHVLRDYNAPASARVSAAVALLDRGHGRPAQQIDAEIVVSVEQKIAMLSPAERLSRLRELTHKARLAIEGQVVEVQMES